MKNSPIYLLLACFFILPLAACNAIGLGGLVGSGNVITEARSVDDFDEIELSYVGELVLIQGDETSLIIEGDDNIVENIKTTVRGNKLIIDTKNNRRFGNIRSFKKLTYTVTTPDLSKLHLSGAGAALTDGFVTDDLALELSGAGSLDFAQIAVDQLDIELSGAGSVNINGAAQSLRVELSGLGSLDAAQLAADTIEIGLSGAGSAEVWARELLDASISGAGSIDYYGSPEVARDISGLGSISGLGEKE